MYKSLATIFVVNVTALKLQVPDDPKGHEKVDYVVDGNTVTKITSTYVPRRLRKDYPVDYCNGKCWKLEEALQSYADRFHSTG